MAALDALTLLATVSEGNISYTKQGRPFIFYTNDNRGHGGGPTIFYNNYNVVLARTLLGMLELILG